MIWPTDEMGKEIEREKRTVAVMIACYCRHKEGNRHLCEECKKLMNYAHTRLSHCPFGDSKTSCRNCSVHCYSPAMAERIKTVMRYSGPRMILCHPVMALRHLFKELQASVH